MPAATLSPSVRAARPHLLQLPLQPPQGHPPVAAFTHAARAAPAPRRGTAAVTRASSSDNPVRTALSGLASNIYKATASFQATDTSLPPLWQGLRKLSLPAVQDALRAGADPNQRNTQGDTPLLYIAREGHYKFPPSEIPALLVQSGADLEAHDSLGRTALQVALLSGWQNIAELLIKGGARTDGVASIKGGITCPDCKRIVASYNL